MEILRKKELQFLLELIMKKPHGKYLITGVAGSGKTFLINVLGKALQNAGMKVAPLPGVLFYNGSMQSFSKDDLETIYLCDGLDEIYHPKRVYEAIQSSYNGVVCTARVNYSNIEFDYEMQLEPLNNEQMTQVFNDILSNESTNSDLLKARIKDTFTRIAREEIFPLTLNILFSYSIADKDYSELIAKIASDYHQVYTYGKRISLQSPEIIVPERKIISVPSELKNDINVVNSSLLDRVSRTPKLLYEITPRQFEELVCELFQKKGYNVQLTKQTGDGGKDIIVLNNSFLGDFIIYAECKQYAKSRPVGVSLVRQLYGTVEADKATAGIMITTSTFSKEARKFRESVRGRMSLMDYTELMKQIIMFK